MADFIDYRDHELHVEIKDGRDLIEVNYRDDGKLHTMERHISEPLEKTLIRIGRNFQKKVNRKKKKGSKKSAHDSGSIPQNVQLSRSDGSCIIDLDQLTNAQWESGMRVIVHDSLTLAVVLNAPLVTSVGVFPKRLARVNNPLVPYVLHEFSCGVMCAWFAKTEDESAEYSFVSASSIFCPGPELEGCSLKLFCTPFRCLECTPQESHLSACSCAGEKVYGRTVVHYYNKQLLPEIVQPKVLECREEFLQESSCGLRSSSTLRLVTFNILSSAYVQSAHALSVLYDYLDNPDVHLSDEYRLQLVSKELVAYRGDIVCLQEVDESAYQKYLNPIFTQIGYSSHHTTKHGSTSEGCATFVSTSKFNILATVNISMKDAFQSIHNSSHHCLQDLLLNRPDVRKILTEKVTTIAQISILNFKSNPSHLCLVVNTHLFYHPDAAYVRLLQTHEIVQRLECIKASILKCNEQENISLALECYLNSVRNDAKEYHDHESNGFEAQLKQSKLSSEAETGSANELKQGRTDAASSYQVGEKISSQRLVLEVSCFMFGDLNSTPNTGALEYIERGVIEPSHNSWKSIDLFSWSQDEPINSNQSLADCYLPRLTHNFQWHCATGYPRYSNFTKTFKEQLDYIFVERRQCNVLQIAPIPTDKVLSENCAIPSEVFPSDHLSLVVDIEMTSSFTNERDSN